MIRGESGIWDRWKLFDHTLIVRGERVGEQILMHLNPDDVFNTRPVLEKYLRKVARNDLTTRTEYWADRLSLHPNKVIVENR